jgi:NAD(P)-dependent dehydrogenase (short-subunit alcohol dehydrogenase family)
MVAAVGRLGGSATIIQADVSKVAGIDQLFTATMEHYGHIDIVVANTGIDAASSGPRSFPLFGSTVARYPRHDRLIGFGEGMVGARGRTETDSRFDILGHSRRHVGSERPLREADERC